METSSKSASNVVFSLRVQYVFVARNRLPVFSAEMHKDLQQLLPEALKKTETQLLAYSGAPDHIRVDVGMIPTVTVSEVANVMKSAAARRMWGLHPDRVGQYMDKGQFWHRSYMVGTAGQAFSTEDIDQYLAKQGSRKRQG
ncbi:IS200/IS605 family transposase [Pseudomonas aeruginosa]